MILLAIMVALSAAALFGLSSVLEQRATKQVPPRRALSPRLLVDLIRHPLWLIAITINVIGNAAQVVALHFGALALVQPLLVCDLLFAVLISVALRHRRPDRVMLAGALCCTAGLACFVAVARPGGGHGTVSFPAAAPLIAALAGVLAGCLGLARWGSRRFRPVWLALACGADFGVTAFLLKLVPDTLPQGFADPLRQWPLYLLVIIGPVGFLLNQNAFQAGLLVAPVLAIITTVDPLTSIAIAHLWLGERMASTTPDLAAEAGALAVMTAGIIALARRSPAAAARITEGARSSRTAGRPGPVRRAPARPDQGQCAAPGRGQHRQGQHQ
jgi:drug/metabolite transporter (DMT)-like permease